VGEWGISGVIEGGGDGGGIRSCEKRSGREGVEVLWREGGIGVRGRGREISPGSVCMGGED